jgi:hypothetical protein
MAGGALLFAPRCADDYFSSFSMEFMWCLANILSRKIQNVFVPPPIVFNSDAVEIDN